MEILIVVLLVAVLVALAGVIATSRKPAPEPTAPPPAFPSTEELTSQIKLVNEQALNGAIAELNQRAEAHREETIRTVTQMVTQQSGEALGKRAEVISTTLKGVHDDVSKRLAELNHELDQLRQHNAGQFSSVSEAVTLLAQRTANLNEVLSSSQKRGQWGERLAEDMIRAAGLVEGVNYSKQDTTAAGGRPDFTFTMPPDRVLFMDVKFPLDRYVAHLDADDDATRATTKADFVKAVRSHVDALAKRDYIDQTTEDALDYVLMFVPNESISGFVHEADPHLIDWALERKVVLCSPLTLYAFLVVIRQATESFHTEQTAAEITQQINKFSKEFDNYSAAVDKVRATFNKLDNELGAIATDGTRFRKLSVPIRAIEKLRKPPGIGELDAATDDVLNESVDDF